MELSRSSKGVNVVVDYAHTPDALQKALLSVRQHCAEQLWCVFGCGGDRDQNKRPLMGAAADEAADQIVLTNDNPRSEDPATIIDQIAKGIRGDYQIVLDRATAIVDSINQAKPGDWVLVAGKGHEPTQEIGGEIFPFSDQAHVQNALGLAS